MKMLPITVMVIYSVCMRQTVTTTETVMIDVF